MPAGLSRALVCFKGMVQVMIGRQHSAGVVDRPRKAVSARGLIDSTQRKHRPFATIHRPKRTINWRKVREARQRLALGQYDRDDVFDGILEMILASLAEPQLCRYGVDR